MRNVDCGTKIIIEPSEKIKQFDTKKQTRGFVRAQQKRQRLLQLIPDDALIVALDLARKGHRVWMSTVRKQPLHQLSIEHSVEGMQQLLRCAREIQAAHALGQIVFAMEPTSHYWMNVATYFEHHDCNYVLVHPLSVKRERESTYYRYSKSDYRDAELIANLCAERKVTFTQLPKQPLWAELKSAAIAYLTLTVMRSGEQMRLQCFLERLCPSYREVFSELSGITARACLLAMREVFELPYEEFLLQVRNHHVKRRLYRCKVEGFYDLVRFANPEWGALVYQDALRLPIAHAAERYELFETQITECEQQLLQLYERTEYAAYLNSIPHIGAVWHAATLGLIGDPAHYDSSRCLTRFAGMDIKEKQSGQFQGKTPITHRGHPWLRYVSYVAGFVLKTHDPVFRRRYSELTSRKTRPLKKNQALVALGCKYLRIVWTLCNQKTYYDSQKARYGTKVKKHLSGEEHHSQSRRAVQPEDCFG